MDIFDVEKVRNDFPIFSKDINGKPLVYLDNGATTQKPNCVIESLSDFYKFENANIHRGIHYLSREATKQYESSRTNVKEFLGVSNKQELIFLRGATEAINLIANGVQDDLKRGDEIIITLMEHHANIVPWQVLSDRVGVKINYIKVNQKGDLDLESWKKAFNKFTKIVSFTHISNVLGTINPVEEMVKYAKNFSSQIQVIIDGAQAVSHRKVNVGEIGADYYVFSGHKMFAPYGIGGLIGNKEKLNNMRPYQTGGDMINRVTKEGSTFKEVPERFEAGTPNIAGAIALSKAVQYINKFDSLCIEKHEDKLMKETIKGLKEIEGIKIYGNSDNKISIISFFYDKAHPYDISTILDTEGVAVRDGHHCAQPLLNYFNIPSSVRVSFSMYNNLFDVECFLRAMRKVVKFFE